MPIKISVIIPIYAVEQYLEECVNSVLRQSYRNIEVILVDDGSPDNSPKICDTIANFDERIKVIHKINGGLSDARNAGIREATGDYVLFLDGDDFWDDNNAMMRLVERIKLTKADVLNFSYKKYFEDTGEKKPYFNKVKKMPTEFHDKNQQLNFLTRNGLYIASACNKLIRRELLNAEMQFCKEVYSEDIDWCARLLRFAKSMDFVYEDFYCYRQRKFSITHTINKRKCDDLCANILACVEIINLAEEKEQLFLKRYIAYQYGTFFKIQALSSEKAIDSINRLTKYAWLLSYHSNNRKLIILHIVCRIIGFQNTCGICRYIYQKQR